MEKTEITMNKPVYLGLSILELGKTLMHQFWDDSIKPKYSENAKLCYLDTDNFIVHVKTDDTFKDIGEDVKKRFDTSKYEIEKLLPKGKNKNLSGLMKYELVERVKTYSYLKENKDEDKEAKGIKRCVIKRKLTFKDYNNCLKASEIGNIINYFKKKKFMQTVL